MNDYIKDKVIHDKEITLFGSERDERDGDVEIFIDDIEEVKMVKQSGRLKNIIFT